MRDIRSKIVCTLGPSSSDHQTVLRLIKAGMDVARLNFSHSTHAEHLKLIRVIKRARQEAGRLVAILMDLQGPKIRVGTFAEGAAFLPTGGTFTITMDEVEGTAERVSTTYKGLARDVKKGDVLLLDDGMITLHVARKRGSDVICEVVNGGVLKNNKGINLPGVALSVETLSRKDLRDADFALQQGADFLAMSFVRHPNDVRAMRAYLKRKKSTIPIVTKIEKPQALDYIDEIIAISDAVMVARGDLGVEMATEQVPGIQKMIIHKCNQLGVPVITATQMLDSMIHNPRPTRAEASDVANAILDGSDAVMLSGESASGKYPVDAVQVMKRIIETTEAGGEPPLRAPHRRTGDPGLPLNEGIAITACALAEQVDARAIACITLSGSIARTIAKHRPMQPIYAISHHEAVARRLGLSWGIRPIVMKVLEMANIDDALPEIERMLTSRKLLIKGDRFVLSAGLPFSARQVTNMVRVDEVG